MKGFKSSMRVPVSILDLAQVGHSETPSDSFKASVDLAVRAEKWGYRRIWYAEHHNISRIASSATSVLVAHIAAQTRTIRVGAGGVMLPNHAPLTIAEQFGTLETLHPGRIDLGLGRAPGSNQQTQYALRRDSTAADRFPQEVQELQGYLAGESLIPGVDANPGKGTDVPLYILGSSLFGAELAAALGLPYSFASHFAPNALHDAAAAYRREFTPSKQLQEPHFIAGANIIATDTMEQAQAQFQAAKRSRLRQLTGRNFTREEANTVLDSRQGQEIQNMVRYSAVGPPEEMKNYLDRFAEHTGADELIVASPAPERDAWLRSFELLAEVGDLTPA